MKREPGGAGRAFRTCANWTLSRGRRDRGTEFGRKCLEWPWTSQESSAKLLAMLRSKVSIRGVLNPLRRTSFGVSVMCRHARRSPWEFGVAVMISGNSSWILGHLEIWEVHSQGHYCTFLIRRIVMKMMCGWLNNPRALRCPCHIPWNLRILPYMAKWVWHLLEIGACVGLAWWDRCYHKGGRRIRVRVRDQRDWT